jgi:uncharacterized membrane protein (UPF0127 family)
MKHLQFPFAEKVTIEITNDKKKVLVDCELASSEIEIFQSLSYRTKKDFKNPLVLLFDNPTTQYLSRQSFNFPVIQVNVSFSSNLVKKVSFVPKSNKENGQYIQSYAEFSLVVLLPKDFHLVNQIKENKTTLKISRAETK